MYKLHLILKYLLKRRIAWVSLAAVMLCTAMVIIVISVMGGWIEMFRSSVKGMNGDVVVLGNSLTGFPYYEEMMEELKRVPEIEATTPVLKSFALLNIGNQKPMGVQVYGFQMETLPKVNGFATGLWRQYNEPLEEAKEPGRTDSERELLQRKAEMGKDSPSFVLPLDPQIYRDRLPKSKFDESKRPGMIVGYGVVNIRRTSDKRWVIGGERDGRPGPALGKGEEDFLYQIPVKLIVLSMSSGDFSIDLTNKTENRYWMVDFSRSGMWQYDQNSVYVPFEVLQKDLGMSAVIDEHDPTQNRAARTTELHVKLKAGVSLARGKTLVKSVVEQVLRKPEQNVVFFQQPVVQTWEEAQATFLSAIENERLLLLFLFGIISLVAVFLIFCIFYMIVVEKTRDIGIIKSVGATDAGVAGIFLGYGAAIGIVGSGLGLLAAWLIVHNINYLHAKLGELMGLQIWNPEVYMFDTIPNRVDLLDATIIMGVAICFSVAGALIPAWRAARMNPVEALRWE